MTPTIKPPLDNRLVCSHCGGKTSYPTDGEYRSTCSMLMERGGVYVAFCDDCETKLGIDGGSIVVLGQLPPVTYVTGQSREEQ